MNPVCDVYAKLRLF